MKIDKTLVILKSIYLCAVQNSDTPEEKNEADALEMAIRAIKKQIPEKPKITLHGTSGLNTKASCPCCGGMVFNENYCRKCGQALDWSGEDGRQAAEGGAE